MRNIKNPNQQNLIDPWAHLGKKVRKMLDSSWSGLFRSEILPLLPVAEFSKDFDDTTGRLSKEIHAGLGMVLLQQIHDLTDAETMEAIAFNMQWHYALNITGNSDSETHICLKTLYNIRNKIIAKNLDQVIFDNIKKRFIEFFNVDTDKQRIDSKQIVSNMSNLGRVRIFTHTINKFLRNLKKSHKELFEQIDEDIVEKYTGKKSMQYFSMVKPSKSQKTLKEVASDLFILTELFKENNTVANMHSFKLIMRVLNDQCEILEKDDKTQIKPKAPKDIPSDSLQNPSDPDASYSGHKGQGYQVQVMETFQEDKDETKPNIITYVETEGAHNSDAHALTPALEKTAQDGICPKEAQADTVYASDENCEKAAEMGVELVGPAPRGKEKDDRLHLSDFELSDDGEIIACPEGRKPVSTKRNKSSQTLLFDSASCDECAKNKICPVKKKKKYHSVNFSGKTLRLTKRRLHEKTDEFKERYRMRAGVEATMAEFDRRTGVGHVRYRGLRLMQFAVFMKAVGINLFRATRAKAAQLHKKQHENHGQNPFDRIFFVFKEQMVTFGDKMLKNFALRFAFCRF